MIPALKIPALQSNRAPSPTLERGGICTPALLSPRGVSMEAGAGLVESKGSSPQPHLGHTNSKRPGTMEIIHLAQPALHRLGTDEAASKGRPEKHGWREAEAAPARPSSGLGTGGSTAWSVQGDLGRGDTKQPNNSSGVCLGLLLTSHRLRGTPQKTKISKTKRKSLRGLVQNILSPASRCLPSPASPEPCRACPGLTLACKSQHCSRCHKDGSPRPCPVPRTWGAPGALEGAHGRFWEHRIQPLLLGGTLLGRGPGLPVPCREHPPGGHSGHSQSSARSLRALVHALAGFFHRWDVGLKHPHLGAGGVSPSPQEQSIHTNTSSGHRGVPTLLTPWQRAQGPAGLPMDTMECSAVAPCTPTVIGTPRSSQGSVLSCR